MPLMIEVAVFIINIFFQVYKKDAVKERLPKDINFTLDKIRILVCTQNMLHIVTHGKGVERYHNIVNKDSAILRM